MILARPDDLDEKEDSMALNKGNKSLRDLLAARGKESTLKTTPQTQVAHPPPPQIPIDLSLKANPDLKKKRPIKTLKEGEVGPQKGTMESREEQHRADVRMPQRIWSPRLEVDGAPIPWGASVREF